MDDLCTACLCSGRHLYFIGETGFYNLYTQILNEIPVYDFSQVCVRICWECRAVLRRVQLFKRRVKASYSQLLLHLHQNTPKESLSEPSNLQIQHITSISYPCCEVKLELDAPDDHEESYCADSVKYELDETHCEPETFVKDLHVHKKETKSSSKDKTTANKKKKPKVKKKKKVKKKRKEVKSEVPVILDVSDGRSDADSVLEQFQEDAEVERREESRCNECDVVFQLKSELERHIETDHAVEEPPPPPEGSKANGVPGKPARASGKEALAERPQCVECGKIFSSRKTYRYHLNVLHKGQNRYPCPRCGKVYQWKSNLGRHMRSHKARDSGELYCDTCDKRFASVATYRQHLRISRRHVTESEFSFQCNECDKKFVNKTRLRDHIDWEHLKKIKFRCQLCNKPFKCHTSLYVHAQNVHRNKEKKDNLCHVCGKSYQNAAKLKYHIVAMHTSETPYQCEQCSAAFGWYSSLYRHVREVHHKMKVQPKRSKKGRRAPAEPPPPLGLPVFHQPPAL